jgi:hypothetical protein
MIHQRTVPKADLTQQPCPFLKVIMFNLDAIACRR